SMWFKSIQRAEPYQSLYKSFSFGHSKGDEALILLAQTFRKILREDDLIGRIGGEEFGILLPDTSEVEGQVIGELIRHEVENIIFEPRQGVRYVMTISIGITNATKNQERSLLMRNADAALFEAKRRGRNQAVMFEPGMRLRLRSKHQVLMGGTETDIQSISR
ncbi:MAG: GGDEF domain-containing protein, partial [Pseudomonadota bacterium]